MRAAMYSSHFQPPRYQFHRFSGSWWERVHHFSRRGESSPKFGLLIPSIYGLQGGHGRQWYRKSVSTNTEGKNSQSRKTNISQQITDVRNLHTIRVDISECESIDIEQKISENKDPSNPITIIVFDIETTGFSRSKERIIEIALRDLSGGVNSTFQTLVNPEKPVTNTDIHGITSYMVTRPGVPRMNDLIPILLRYIKSRQKPGGQMLLIAHNGKSFDVPFLKSEFSRCSYEIPLDWIFLDSMCLTYKLMKAEGSTLSKRSLEALREYYNIPLNGKAHRALADVDVLALVLQRMTRDLKLTVSSLLAYHAFTASGISNGSKKKKKTSC